MKARLLSVLVAAMIAGVASYSPLAESQPELAAIDFVQLNSQAMAALQTLRFSQEIRFAQQDTGELPSSQ